MNKIVITGAIVLVAGAWFYATSKIEAVKKDYQAGFDAKVIVCASEKKAIRECIQRNLASPVERVQQQAIDCLDIDL